MFILPGAEITENKGNLSPLCVDGSSSCILSVNAFCKEILRIGRNLKSGSTFIPLMEAAKIGPDLRFEPPAF